MSSPRRVRPLALLVAAAAVLAVPALASAETITVSTTTDAAPVAGECFGLGSCSLRQAIDTANKDAGPDSVVLPAGTYQLTIAPSGADGTDNGDLDLESGTVTIKGAGARKSVVDASGLGDRVFHLHSGADVIIQSLAVSGGRIGGETEELGGGIFGKAAQLTLENVTVSGNVAAEETRGGGIALEEMEAAIIASTISGNRNSGDGGGLYVKNSEVLVENSTIAQNSAETSLFPSEEDWGAYGGAAEFDEDNHVSFVNSTIAGNRIIDDNGGEEGTGAAFSGSLANITAINTIVADNTATEVEESGQCEAGPFASAAYSIETAPPSGERRCFEGATNLLGDPLLAPLANYGGETDTIALYEGSPALGAAHEAQCPEFDQRGVERTGACNMGAWNGAGIPKPPPPAPPIVPIAPPAPKATPAAATISTKGKVVVKLAGRTFSVQPGISVNCPAGGAACAVTLKATTKAPKPQGAGTSAKAKRLTLGKASLSVAAGSTKALVFKLTKKAANLLSEEGKLKATIEVSASATGAKTATAKKSPTLKLPPPEH